MRRLTFSLAIGFLTLGTSAWAQPQGMQPAVVAQAEAEPAHIALSVIHAKSGDSLEISPELEKLSRFLPSKFPDYREFKRLSRREEVITKDGELAHALPNGTQLKLKHLGWKDGFASISIEVGGLASVVKVKDGKGFFQAGRSYDKGMLILAIRVSSEQKP